MLEQWALKRFCVVCQIEELHEPAIVRVLLKGYSFVDAAIETMEIFIYCKWSTSVTHELIVATKYARQ